MGDLDDDTGDLRSLDLLATLELNSFVDSTYAYSNSCFLDYIASSQTIM